ncbi:MAG: Ldh family oxidoreductase [Alphaproteobacteria bacterium]|nr:Ldh family oxidoreductase [Alphaproteobacteria bacterium]
MAAERMHLSVAEAREHSERALRGIGYNAEEARIIADHAIDAALCGYEYSGLAKLLNIPEHRRFKRPRSAMRVLRETELSTLYDGGNNVGMLVMYHAARAAIDKAAARGVAIVGVTNSWMSGRSAYYMEMIAKADLVGIHTAASARSVAPFGGIRPALGTNPIAFGMPSSRGPAGRWSSTRGPRRLWGQTWPIARVSGSCFPRGWRSMPKGGRRAIRPWPGSGRSSPLAAIRVSGSRSLFRLWVCSPARRSTRTRTTATCLSC